MDNKNRSLHILIWLSAIILFIYFGFNSGLPDYREVLIWALIAVIMESFPLQLPNKQARVSCSYYAVAIFAILLGGPFAAMVVLGLGLLLRVYKEDGRFYHLLNSPPRRTFLNVGLSTVMIALMGSIYLLLGGETGTIAALPALVALNAGILLNFAVSALLISFENKRGFWEVWNTNLAGIFFVKIAQGVYGACIAYVYLTHPYVALLLFFATAYATRNRLKQYLNTMGDYLATIMVINRLVEIRDPYTSGHTSRVQELSLKLANEVGLKQNSLDRIKKAARLHDIGKIGINDAILDKPGALTKKEFEEIKKHPVLGAEIVEGIVFLRDGVDIILHHHERYDGKGYPQGLKGDEIPVEACIVSIADAYDAMTSDRPYRDALTKEEALEEIKLNSGTQFHPQYAEAFLVMMNR